MKRIQTFQLTAQPWFPQRLTRLVHEFLLWFVARVGAAKPFLPILEEALERSESGTVYDLSTGVGSGTETVRALLPGVALERVDPESGFEGEGVFAVINGFHRLTPTEAELLLRRVTDTRQVVVVLEGNNDHWWQAVGMLFFAPVTAFLTAPFVRPFRFERLLFTYLIPILPFLIAFDGAMALFMLYAPSDLDEVIERVGAEGYEWRTGKEPNGRGGKIIYGLGYPVEVG
ncbi:MAG: hypothetical protein AAGK22_28155 [Acidobacteriota bacterium]